MVWKSFLRVPVHRELKRCFKKNLFHIQATNYSAEAYTGRYDFETLSVSCPGKRVLHVEINRPEVYNALNKDLFREVLDCFKSIQDDKHCRVVVISGAGKHFSSGLDYHDLKELLSIVTGTGTLGEDFNSLDVARKAKYIRSMIQLFQDAFTALEKCDKPVISVIQGACIGAALGFVASSDIRYCSSDAFFQIKDVDVGFASDLGVLQRVPKMIGNQSVFRELVYTSRKATANEAKEMGLVGKVFADYETTKQAAIELAINIAKKSPVAVQGSKLALKYSQDHSIWDGLNYMANWNMVMLQSKDVEKATTAVVSKTDQPPSFDNL